MYFAFYGRILRRHPKGIPTHGMKNITTSHPLITGHHITNGIIAHMTHVNFPRWVGKHLQQIIFFTLTVNSRKSILLFPVGLPFQLNFLRIILRFHHLHLNHQKDSPAVHFPCRFSSFSCSSLQVIHKGATGRASKRPREISSPQASQMP